MIRAPKPLIAGTNQAAWQNRSRELHGHARPGFGNVQMAATTKGVSYFQAGGGGLGGSASLNIKKFTVVDVEENHVNCKDEDDNDAEVLLPRKLRAANYHNQTITIPPLGGIVLLQTQITFQYQEAQIRTATVDQLAHVETIVPRYLADDILYVIEWNEDITWDGDSVSYSFLDLNTDARAWARIS